MQDILNLSVIVHRIIVYGPIVVVYVTYQFFRQLTPVYYFAFMLVLCAVSVVS